jgi:hypothetical protein
MLDNAAIKLLIGLARETQRVRPKGHEAKVVCSAPEQHYESLAASGFVKKEPYPLTDGIAYSITAEGERHCRFALNGAEIINPKGKRRRVYENLS